MICCPQGYVKEEPFCDLDEVRDNADTVLCGACGERSLPDTSTLNLAGGEDALPGNWPWMALLGYQDKVRSKDINYNCGGTLITMNTVLTAAHCLDNLNVVEVRLGETDLSTEYDCLDPGFQPSCVCKDGQSGCPFNSYQECLEKDQCAERHFVVTKITRQIIHPLYDQLTWVSRS